MKKYFISAALGLAAIFLFAQEHDHGQSQQVACRPERIECHY